MVVSQTPSSRCGESRTIRWPVCLWLPAVGRFVNVVTRELARDAVVVVAPLTVPFVRGQVVEISFPHDLPAATIASLRAIRARVAEITKEDAVLAGEQVMSLALIDRGIPFLYG